MKKKKSKKGKKKTPAQAIPMNKSGRKVWPGSSDYGQPKKAKKPRKNRGKI